MRRLTFLQRSKPFTALCERYPATMLKLIAEDQDRLWAKMSAERVRLNLPYYREAERQAAASVHNQKERAV